MKPTDILSKRHSPDSWADWPWGEYYREALSDQLQPWLSKLCGFHLLKIGNLSAELNTQNCTITHQINVGGRGARLHMVADPYQLPFIAKSIDACLLAHVLCHEEEPYRLLCEVDRVMVNDGWLLISNFNAFSLAGASRLLSQLHYSPPYISRLFTRNCLSSWLHELNYEVLEQVCFHVLPWQPKDCSFLSTHLPALGCINFIVARKRTQPLTPISMKAAAKKQLVGRTVGATKSYRDLV
jgi:SAM-dependent methyltransferase